MIRSLAAELLATVDALPERFLLGITGPPGAGKSTLATGLARTVGERRGEGFAVVAPLDGFHLPNQALEARGLRAIKGAPETFDPRGFLRFLQRVRSEPGGAILWPDFNRALEETVPEAIAITPETKLVITEGNYLLLDRPWWREVRPLLDDVWYVDAPRELLRTRLIERQLAGGRAEEDAVRHVDGSDLPNADLVARTRARASRTVRL